MPVVINEFEVVSQPASGSQAPETPAAESETSTPGITPRDVERRVRHELARLARVQAH